MKILMVTPSFYPITGGTETVVMELAKELNNIGVHVDILTFNMNKKWIPKWRYKTERINGITVYKIPALNWLPIAHSPRLTLKLNLIPGRFRHLMKDYDLIHFHEAEFSFPFFSLFIKKPKLLHLHGIKFNFFKRYHLSRLMLKNSSDMLLSLTSSMTKELMMLGVPEEKIVRCPNFVDPKKYQPNTERADNKLLYVGRIVARKGLLVLLESLNFLKSPVELDIIGPPGWDETFNQKILKLIESKNRTGKHKINYLGCVEHSRLIEAYRNTSIFVSSSYFEPFGVVILEAMACQAPVVSTRTEGAIDLIENGVNGLTVPIGDAEKLAGAIQYLLDNKQVRAEIAQTGRKLVSEKYSICVRVKELCQLYETILNNKAKCC